MKLLRQQKHWQNLIPMLRQDEKQNKLEVKVKGVEQAGMGEVMMVFEVIDLQIPLAVLEM